ncbi:MAG: hypothetical protein A2W11_11280 [Ignavibacteria bacterium RBG_16_35_7]|nr:MAG: hypothetical protein A2W11_11280 [Ignavibacteria bacterium RBG_16_35_7]
MAYKYAHIKILIGDKDLLQVSQILEREDDPHLIMMAANCYYVIRDYEKAEFLSLKAIAYNGNIFDENLFAQYVRINIGPKPGIPDIAELEAIIIDCTVLLESESENLWIGITSKNELLVEKNNFTFADTHFYYRNNDKVIHLISSPTGEIIRFNNKEWKIKDIWKIKTRVVRFCMFEYTSKVHDSKFLQMIQISEKNPLESMMPLLVEGEIYDKETLADYNFRNRIGLPLNQIAKRKARNLVDAILYILETPHQPFYVGDVGIFDLKEKKIVISCSSIIILVLSDLLEKFINKYKSQLIISEETKNYFIEIVDKMNTEEYGIAMSMGISNGKYLGTDYTEEFKQKRLKFFNRIVICLSKLETISFKLSPEELDDKSKYIDLISLSDYENLKYVNENGYIYLVDDLFVRKTKGIFSNDIVTISSVSLLYDLLLDDINLLLEKIELLSNGGYNYLFNIKALTRLSEQLFEKYRIVGKGSPYEKLLNIIHNSLSHKIIFLENLKIIVEFISYLYHKRFDERAGFIIHNLIKELWRYISLFGIDHRLLLSEIFRICENDANKVNYFYDVLRQINSDY